MFYNIGPSRTHLGTKGFVRANIEPNVLDDIRTMPFFAGALTTSYKYSSLWHRSQYERHDFQTRDRRDIDTWHSIIKDGNRCDSKVMLIITI